MVFISLHSLHLAVVGGGGDLLFRLDRFVRGGDEAGATLAEVGELGLEAGECFGEGGVRAAEGFELLELDAAQLRLHRQLRLQKLCTSLRGFQEFLSCTAFLSQLAQLFRLVLVQQQ